MFTFFGARTKITVNRKELMYGSCLFTFRVILRNFCDFIKLGFRIRFEFLKNIANRVLKCKILD